MVYEREAEAIMEGLGSEIGDSSEDKLEDGVADRREARYELEFREFTDGDER